MITDILYQNSRGFPANHISPITTKFTFHLKHIANYQVRPLFIYLEITSAKNLP